MKKLSIQSALFLSVFSATSAFAAGNTKQAGDVLTVLLPITAAGLSYHDNDTEGIWQLVKSEGTALLITEALKSSVHEMRPDHSDNKSFPSGHVVISFAAAQYLQMKGNYEFGIPAYAASTFVAYSRVHSRQHYWKDVIAGGAIGIGSSYYFTKSASGPRLSYVVGPNRYTGLQFSTNL